MQHPGGHGGGGKGHGAKHTRHKKHVRGKGKHHPKHQPQGHHQGFVQQVTTVAHHPHHPRGLATGSLLPVCTFEAVAQSLRLAGQRVSEDDMLGLWDLCGQREVSIAEALAAAAKFGLTGCRPDFEEVMPREPGHHRSCTDAAGLSGVTRAGRVPLLLGVDLPGPHAVLATPDGWWSWGSLHAPWTTAVSEAWAVSWS